MLSGHRGCRAGTESLAASSRAGRCSSSGGGHIGGAAARRTAGQLGGAQSAVQGRCSGRQMHRQTMDRGRQTDRQTATDRSALTLLSLSLPSSLLLCLLRFPFLVYSLHHHAAVSQTNRIRIPSSHPGRSVSVHRQTDRQADREEPAGPACQESMGADVCATRRATTDGCSVRSQLRL